MNLQDVFNPSEISCKCGSVETAQRLSAALADSTSRNTELQSKIADLQERLGANTSVEDVENLEKRALAAERRLEIARTAMTRYVTESQKCSPAPVVHSTIDDLTPMKHAVERWKEYSDAHPGEDARPNENDPTNARRRPIPRTNSTRQETIAASYPRRDYALASRFDSHTVLRTKFRTARINAPPTRSSAAAPR